MPYTIKAGNDDTKNTNINLAPGSLEEEVLQNLTMILSVLKSSVPLDRDFGLTAEFIDKPARVAEALITSEIINSVEKYEPRAQVLNVLFENSEDTGKTITTLEVEINAG